MKFYYRTLSTTACFLSLAALTPAMTRADDAPAPTSPTTPPAPAVKKGKGDNEAHPTILNSIKDLEAIRRHLNDAGHDFGGHKERAIKACDDAIEQLRAAAKFDRNDNKNDKK